MPNNTSGVTYAERHTARLPHKRNLASGAILAGVEATSTVSRGTTGTSCALAKLQAVVRQDGLSPSAVVF